MDTVLYTMLVGMHVEVIEGVDAEVTCDLLRGFRLCLFAE